ncbi:uncharacterized protein LOC134727771 [Mytilus trossulus]|uniref:uncharacterized protein LOC134727771 n=1 Tax=Mytilus trossulus TaxID=6551 RepID=UPI003007B826
MRFRVEACNDAFILLSSAVNLQSQDFYEICIGGSNNKVTNIHRKYNTGNVHQINTIDILNCTEQRTLIVRWMDNGEITLLKETNGGTEVVMKWTDPNQIPIHGVGIMTGWGADGGWTLEHSSNGADAILIQTFNSGNIDADSTPDVFNYYTNLSEYHLYPSQNKMFRFGVEACHDAFILLSSVVNLQSQDFYEICIGGTDNTASSFRRKYNTGNTLFIFTPEILNCTEKRTITLKWTFNGELTLLKETNGGTEVVMTWTDPNPIHIHGVGIMTGWGADGLWTIEYPCK